MAHNLNDGRRWFALADDAADVYVATGGKVIKARFGRDDLPALRYPNVDGMPERVEAISPWTLLSAIVCTGIMGCLVAAAWF